MRLRSRASKWANAFAAATSIPRGTYACRGMRAASSALSSAITACLFSRIRTRTCWARSRSTFTPCVSVPANSGVSKPRLATRCTSISGTIILSQPDPATASGKLSALPLLPRDEGGPMFVEPWQAQAFALAVRLSEQGHFTWKEWAAALADELKAAADRGEPDDGSHYYEHWLAALERLVTAKGLSDPAAMLARKEAWADAYRHTPHGKPVEFQGDH